MFLLGSRRKMLKNALQICLVCVLNGLLTSGESIKKIPARWSTSVLQDRVSVSTLNVIEPGFDLTDDEIKKFKLWPKGIISYYIDDFSFDKVLRDRMRRYLDVTSGVTGLHFLELPIPPNDGSRWVFFVNRRGLLGCTDHSIQNFTNEGIQKVVLGYDCICNGGELAEVVLAIAGVPPQHNAPDRDNYVKVHTDKILPGKQYLYTKLHDRDWLFHDLEYDFSSAGHYNFHKHSIDGSATIEPKKTVDFPVGEGEGFSYADVLKIRMLYNYISRKQGNVKAPECKKLFKPGTNFNKYRTEKEDDQEPRKKPNKYLGLPDNEPHHSLEYDETINNNDEEPEYDENDDEYIQKNDDDEYIQEKDENQQSIVKTRFTKFALKGNPPKIKDPLAELSDYGTDDDRRRKKKDI